MLQHVLQKIKVIKEQKTMTDELKPRSFRVTEDTAERFKQLCTSFGNQNSALDALINAYEVQQAKAVLSDRQTDINDYDTHLQALQSAFLRSLELNENAEKRIRQEFQRQLESKDLTITDLQERIRTAEQDKQTALEQVKEIEVERDKIQTESSLHITNLNNDLQATNKALHTANEQIVDKQSLLDELRARLEKAEKNIAELPELKERATRVEQQLKASEQECKRLMTELERKTSDFENEKKMLQEKAEISKEKAVIAEQQAFNRALMKQNDEIKSLYSDKDKLRQEIKELQQVIAELQKATK